MTKVAIKSGTITPFGEIYHVMDVFSNLGLENLTETVVGKRGSSGKAYSYGSICHEEWRTVEINYEKCDVASLDMDDFVEGKSYRLVVQRSPLKDKEGSVQSDLFGPLYTYRCILTNDRLSTEKDIILFYNARGEREKNFDIQNNDFGWAHLPFSFLAENMVFMLVTAMLKIFYYYCPLNFFEKYQKKGLIPFAGVSPKWLFWMSPNYP